MAWTRRSILALTLLLVAAVVVISADAGAGQRPVASSAPTLPPDVEAVQSVGSPPVARAVRTATPSAPSPTAGPLSLISVSSFEGLHHGTNGPYSNLFAPPDVQVAVGPDHVFEMVNLLGRISTKDGTAVDTFTLDTFFAAASTDFVGDPKVRFDAPSARWFASLADVTTSSVLLAVSTSADPTGPWNHYSFLSSSGCADQPLLGMSDDKVVLSANDFSSCTSANPVYVGAEYWIINKADLLSGASARFARFGPNPFLGSVQPVTSLGPTTTQYLLSAGSGPATTLTLLAVIGVPPGTVTVTPLFLPITPTSVPPNAPQAGTSDVLDTSDARAQDALWEANRLWVALATGCTPLGDVSVRSCIRLIEVDTANATVLQDFDLAIARAYVFYPALRTDGDGHLFVGFGSSSSSEFPGFMVAMRSRGYPTNRIGPAEVVRLGTGPETVACDPSAVCRYGDYFGAARDPSDPSVVWVAGEYGTAAGWATFISGLSATVRVTLSYSVQGNGSGYSPPSLTYMRDEQVSTAVLSTSPTPYAVDAGTSWSVTGVLTGSTGGERWATNQNTSGNATAPSSHAFVYTHQFFASFAFHVTGGGAVFSPPTVSCQRFGAPFPITANGADWIDAASSYSFPILLDGSNASERWRAEAAIVNGTIVNVDPINVAYVHEAYASFDVRGPPGSSVSPASGWRSVGSSILGLVMAPAGWAVGEWIGVGTGAYSGAATSPTIVVAGSFSETAVLFAGLTINAGQGGAVSFFYDGGSGTVASGTSLTIFVRPGTNVTLVAAPADFHDFIRWNGASSSTTSNLTLRITGPQQLGSDFALTESAALALYSSIGVVLALAVLFVIVLVRRRRREPPPPPGIPLPPP